MKQLTYIFIAAALFMVGCRDRNLPPADSQVFLEESVAVGLYLHGRGVLVFNPLEHQTVRRGSAFRLQTDDQSVYLNVQFDTMPSSSNPTVRGTISERGVDGVTDDIYDFQLLEERDGKIWLWNEKQKMGLIFSLR